LKQEKKLLNNDIKASRVQLVTDEWENLWEVSIEDARSKARSLGLDLMEIWRNWNLSIVKLLDYGKFLYRQKKQDQKNKQKWKVPDMKTIRISFKIWEHDLEIRRKQAEKFSHEWHPLKVSLFLKWRENQYGDIALEKITSFVNSMEAFYKLDWPIKKAWNIFLAQLKPTK
jgi:translation initiation factor IF-3